MRLTGGQIIAEYLVRQKVPYVFGIPGHGNVALLDAFVKRKDKIQVFQVFHEQCAVHMADAYYRVSGQPCVATTSIGPGATNTATGIAQAYVDSTAVLLITGSVHTYMRGHAVLQEIERAHWGNFARVMEPIVKRYWTVNRVDQLPYVMHRAFNQMLAGRPGPVLIDLPMDIQAEEADVEIAQPATRVPQGGPHPDASAVGKAAGLLAEAKRPVILAGGGVITAEASAELKELAELLGAAVVTTWMGKGAFPEDSPLYAWHPGDIGASCANELTRKADVLLAIGTRFVDWLASSYRRNITYNIPPTKLIHVDIDPSEIGKNYPTEIGIVADAKSALRDLLVELQERIKLRDYRSSAYYKEIQRLRRQWFDSYRNRRESNASPISISRALKELRGLLPRDTIVVTGAGLPQSQVYQEFEVYEPRTHITSGGFSTMGFTVPGAIGAQLAAPRRQVVGIAGDGDFLATMQELAAATQHDLPILYVVFNNCGWQSIHNLQTTTYGKDRGIATQFLDRRGKPHTPHLAKVAQAFGAHGERIEKPSEIARAVKRALASGKTSVVEMMTSRELPLAGLSKVGWWDVPVPTYLKKARRSYEQARKEEQL